MSGEMYLIIVFLRHTIYENTLIPDKPTQERVQD